MLTWENNKFVGAAAIQEKLSVRATAVSSSRAGGRGPAPGTRPATAAYRAALAWMAAPRATAVTRGPCGPAQSITDGCAHQIGTVDVQPSIGSGAIIVFVTGDVKVRPPRAWSPSYRQGKLVVGGQP